MFPNGEHTMKPIKHSVPSVTDYVKRNDKVAGLKTHLVLNSRGKKEVKVTYNGRFGLGYDGCGTHTHK
ncbi:hypothetical protein BGP_1364 [Beggiatoa sp. PS]|nr:hypothetical protein BGP_1364 [Beggiatoa sp. PS]